jgi:Flp pilus assembly secretin CpaC
VICRLRNGACCAVPPLFRSPAALLMRSLLPALSSLASYVGRIGLVLAMTATLIAGRPEPVRAQEPAVPAPQADGITRLEVITGRSVPLTGTTAISKVTVVNPDVADVVVISETDVVLNALAQGDTDVILWGDQNTPRRHYRVSVRSSSERRQILLSVKFAEVRKEALRNIGTSLRYRASNGTVRGGSGEFNSDRPFKDNGSIEFPNQLRFFTLLTTFNTEELLGLLDAEETRGNARFLAEPNLMAANLEEASFLAGGEIPIPLVQGGGAGQQAFVTIQFREFGVRLKFKGEVLSDSLLKLTLTPEVSSLDFANAIEIQGFRIPSLRTRRVQSTVDVLSNRSLIISGLFNEEREQVKTGLPFLMNIPIIGDLLSSQRWLRNESELIVVVSPVVMDPNNPRAADLLEFRPDSTLPARPAIEKRLPPAGQP